MNDPIIDEIRRANEEEIKHELRAEKFDRFQDDVLGQLYELNLNADLARNCSEESSERLQTINANIYELHTTLKDVRGYLRFIAWCCFVSAVALATIAWK